MTFAHRTAEKSFKRPRDVGDHRVVSCRGDFVSAELFGQRNDPDLQRCPKADIHVLCRSRGWRARRIEPDELR